MKKKKHDVLVLNKQWVPIHIVDWGKGISLIYQEKCRPIRYDDECVVAYTYKEWIDFTIRNADDYAIAKTVNYPIAVPEIIVSVTFNRLPDRQVKYSRQNIFARDGFRCAYCGTHHNRKDLTLDHIIPRSLGGKTTWDNTVSCCFPCNQKKADRSLKECGMKLKVKPKKPEWVSPLDNIGPAHPCKSWKHFMRRVTDD